MGGSRKIVAKSYTDMKSILVRSLTILKNVSGVGTIHSKIVSRSEIHLSRSVHRYVKNVCGKCVGARWLKNDSKIIQRYEFHINKIIHIYEKK